MAPTIVSESGRALASHHAILVFDVLGQCVTHVLSLIAGHSRITHGAVITWVGAGARECNRSPPELTAYILLPFFHN